MKPTPPELAELARAIDESQTPEELLGSLQIWAQTLIHPLDPEERVYLLTPEDKLNYRQAWALARARLTGAITSAEIAQRYDITQESARIDLRGLVGQGMLYPISDKRGRYYVPVPRSGDSTSGQQGMEQCVPQAPLQPISDTLSQQISEY